MVDIGGAAVSIDNALPADKLIVHAQAGGTVETLARGFGCPCVGGRRIINDTVADVLVETTPTNLTDGEPAYGHMQTAIEKGLDIVSANKGPLVLFYKDLFDLARANGSGFICRRQRLRPCRLWMWVCSVWRVQTCCRSKEF